MTDSPILRTPYDLPHPTVMVLSRSHGRKPTGTDWSSFSAQPLRSVQQVLEHYSESRASLAHALRQLAIFVYEVQQSVYITLAHGQDEDDDFHKRWDDHITFRSRLLRIRRDLRDVEDAPVTLATQLEEAGLEDVEAFVLAHTKPYDESKGDSSSEEHKVNALVEAQDWIVGCVLHSCLDISPQLRRARQPCLFQQPSLKRQHRAGTEYLAQRELRTTTGSSWPVLNLTLSSFIEAEDEEAICSVVLEFLRIASRAVTVYLCQAFQVNQTATPLANEFEEGFRLLLAEYQSRVADPLSDTPLRVRKVLAELDFIELYEWLFRFVLPTISRYQSKHTLDYFAFRWTLRAAIQADASDASTVKTALAKIFNLDVVLQRPSSIPANHIFGSEILAGPGNWTDDRQEPLGGMFDPAYIEHTVHQGAYSAPDAHLDFERDCWNLPIGGSDSLPPQVVDAMQIKTDVEDDDTCLICKSDFADEDEGPARQLNVCGHIYHATCLQQWLDYQDTDKDRYGDEDALNPAPIWIKHTLWERLVAKYQQGADDTYVSDREAHQAFVQLWADEFGAADAGVEAQDVAQYVFVEEWAHMTQEETWYEDDYWWLYVEWKDFVDVFAELMALYGEWVA